MTDKIEVFHRGMDPEKWLRHIINMAVTGSAQNQDDCIMEIAEIIRHKQILLDNFMEVLMPAKAPKFEKARFPFKWFTTVLDFLTENNILLINRPVFLDAPNVGVMNLIRQTRAELKKENMALKKEIFEEKLAHADTERLKKHWHEQALEAATVAAQNQTEK